MMELFCGITLVDTQPYAFVKTYRAEHCRVNLTVYTFKFFEVQTHQFKKRGN